jgi:hypothetical protein
MTKKMTTHKYLLAVSTKRKTAAPHFGATFFNAITDFIVLPSNLDMFSIFAFFDGDDIK